MADLEEVKPEGLVHAGDADLEEVKPEIVTKVEGEIEADSVGAEIGRQVSESGGVKNAFPVEDMEFWEKEGKRIAYRNLYVSIPCLLMGFATWAMWGMIAVKMLKTQYNFGVENMDEATRKRYVYTITATAGMSGATYRLVHSFMVKVGGGRNVKVLTTGLLLVPTVLGGILLCNPDTPIGWWILVASFSGFGGGNFASSMSNISAFFPKRLIGTALGLNAGLGNVGVFTALLFVSLFVKFDTGLSDGGELTKPDKSLIGTIPTGDVIYPENGAFIWVPFLVVLTLLARIYMTNLEHVSPGSNKHYVQAYVKILKLISFAFSGCLVGIVASILSVQGGGWAVLPFLVLPIVIMLPVQLLKKFAPEDIKEDIMKQFSIFGNKHTWIMSVIYTMTFGSFIGFSFAFGLLINDLFGKDKNGDPDPNAPSPAVYAPWGPLLGALARPVGGWVADKVQSGSRVTAYSTLLQVVTTALIAVSIILAKDADNPKDYFVLFYVSFMGLFLGSGIGNGSTFRSVPYIFSKEQTGPVLGWTSAIAAYGSFVIPQLFKITNEGGNADYACWIFVAYYVLCLYLNWYYYDRAGSGISC